jgi:hypothetical protein
LENIPHIALNILNIFYPVASRNRRRNVLFVLDEKLAHSSKPPTFTQEIMREKMIAFQRIAGLTCGPVYSPFNTYKTKEFPYNA